MSISDDESSTNDPPPSSTTKLVESIRQAGPVAYLLIAALLLAVIVAIANSGPSTIDGPAATDTTISGEVAATFALEESDGGSTGSETPGPAELRSVIHDFEQCLRDHGLPVRVRSASETDLVLGYRGDGDLEDIIGDPAIEECRDLHLGCRRHDDHGGRRFSVSRYAGCHLARVDRRVDTGRRNPQRIRPSRKRYVAGRSTSLPSAIQASIPPATLITLVMLA